jgi:adenylate kinase family enzyme
VVGSLLVVTGPPGAGKSTVAALLAAQLDHSVLVDGNSFFSFLRVGAIEPWRPEAERRVIPGPDVPVAVLAARISAARSSGELTDSAS